MAHNSVTVVGRSVNRGTEDRLYHHNTAQLEQQPHRRVPDYWRPLIVAAGGGTGTLGHGGREVIATPVREHSLHRWWMVSVVLVMLLWAALPSPASGGGSCGGLSPTIVGSPGPDRLVGTAGVDVIDGLAGADVIEGRGGHDVICGGAGRDELSGNGGDDVLIGGSGDDRIGGGAGDDRLRGSGGDDDLTGFKGRDRLVGGAGDDQLRGGPGTDVCRGSRGVDRAARCERVRSTEIGQRPPLHTQPSPGAVALTFDDGPHRVHTYEVLGILETYGVPATFFVTGDEAMAHPGIVAAIFADGHSVQNHTCTHRHLSTLTDAEITTELRCTTEAIRAAIGVEPRCYRPPSGMTSDRVRSVAAGLGLAEVMWDVNPVDWANPPTNTIIERVLSQAGGGDVVLLHDGGDDRSNTVAALPAIIEGLQQQGLGFETICE